MASISVEGGPSAGGITSGASGPSSVTMSGSPSPSVGVEAG